MSHSARFRLTLAGIGLAALSAGLLTPIARATEGAAPLRTVRYVALGDSFTAAPLSSKPSGTPGGSMGFDGENNPYTCGQSNTNYPRLIARWLGWYTALDEADEVPGRKPHPEFIDASCGGATTDHMDQPQTAAFGYGTNRRQYSAFDGIDHSKLDLVTLGIGGNDLGFGELQSRCVEAPHMPGGRPCNEHYNPRGGPDLLRSKLPALQDKITAILGEIHQASRAPNATILVFGYPDLLPTPIKVNEVEAPEGCYPYIPLLPADAAYLRGVEISLNDAISAAVTAANTAAEKTFAHYVDWSDASRGHDMCQPPGRAWVNGIVLAPPSIPVHPNVLGSAGAARAAIELLKNLYPKRGGVLDGLGVLP